MSTFTSVMLDHTIHLIGQVLFFFGTSKGCNIYNLKTSLEKIINLMLKFLECSTRMWRILLKQLDFRYGPPKMTKKLQDADTNHAFKHAILMVKCPN
jgi:hypothetical protein